MIAAIEQSRGAWLPEIRPAVELGDAASAGDGTRVVCARAAC
jgi:16S rRNA U1498 N3-methylase RsmE